MLGGAMTHLDRAQNLLTDAAEAALAQINQDRGTAPPKLRPLLAYLGENLFDPGLNVAQLMRACNVRDNSLSIEFGAALGQGPRAYIEEHRLQTAVRLLTKTDLKIWQVGELLGYSSLSIFSRAFDRWAGSRPGVFRRSQRQAAITVSTRQDALHSTQLWRQAMSGGLEQEQAGQLIERLQALYPYQNGATDEKTLAARVWRSLDGRGFDDQQLIVSRQVVFNSPALFELLLEKSRTEGRKERERGVEVAELALASVTGCGRQSAQTDLVARAWTWIANARRIALDFSGAEQAFVQAKKALAMPREWPNHLAQAELPTYEAALFVWQRRCDEALESSSRAIELCREHGLEELQIQALLVRGMAFDVAGQLKGVLQDTLAATRLIDAKVSPYLAVSARSGLIFHLIEDGQLQEAEDNLRQAYQLAAGLGSDRISFHLDWLHALLLLSRGALSKAEDLLLAARAGLRREGEIYGATMVGLDLALLYADQGNSRQVIRLAAETLPVLKALRVFRDSLAAFHMLQSAVEKERVDATLLHQVRTALQRSPGL